MIVVIIPAFNEGKRVGDVVRSARSHSDRVIVVDDGSTDDTPTAARRAGADVISHSQNLGAGAATMTGIEAARRMRASIAVTIDADGQHSASEIPLFLAPIQEGKADIVFANRFSRKNAIPSIRRFYNAIGNLITFLVSGLWVSDSQCGFKAFGPVALRDIDIKMSGFEFCTEIVREAREHRWRIAEVPTKVVYSEYTLAKGQSFANGVKTALKILLRSFLR